MPDRSSAKVDATARLISRRRWSAMNAADSSGMPVHSDGHHSTETVERTARVQWEKNWLAIKRPASSARMQTACLGVRYTMLTEYAPGERMHSGDKVMKTS